MNESLVKYLAGLLDADGSMSFAFKSYPHMPDRCFLSLHLRLASSDAVDEHCFIEGLTEQTGFGGVSRYGKNKQFKTWAVTKRADLEMLVPRLVKHMVIKAKHWAWMLNVWRDHRGRALSLDEKVALQAASKESRLNVGPLHTKNHPTWAWVAGYLDGDGWYTNRFVSKDNYRVMNVGAVAHANDMSVLNFLQESFGGNIWQHSKSSFLKIWRRNLGARDASFAIRFLPKVAKHSRLKRHKIDQMIHHHRQRLSVPSPEGQATV